MTFVSQASNALHEGYIANLSGLLLYARDAVLLLDTASTSFFVMVLFDLLDKAI